MKKISVFFITLFVLAAAVVVHAAAEEPLSFIQPTAEERFLSPAAEAAELPATVDDAALAAYLRAEFGKGTEMIDISAFQIPYSQESANAVARFIWDELVECFHVQGLELGAYSGDFTAQVLKVTYIYTPEEYAQMMAVWQANTEMILYGLTDSTLTDVQKALLIHDRLAVLCEYDYENLQNGMVPDASFDVYGVLVNEIAVCQGYAEAYQYLLDLVGIESYICTSKILNHAWNIVLIDGQYYHVDVTWDDPVWDVGGRVLHEYFLCSTAAFMTSHEANDYDTTPVATTYDNYFWQTSDAAFQLVNGELYYIDHGTAQLKRYDGTALLSVDAVWPVDEIKYYTENFARLASNGENLYYSLSDAVYKYDLHTGMSGKVFQPVHTFGDYFSIYGFTYEDGLLVCELNTSPDYTGDTKKNYRVTGTVSAPEIPAPQPAVVASGICGADGDNLTWVLTDDGTLTISGTGAMDNWNNWGSSYVVPWYSHQTFIRQVVIGNGVTSVGKQAFADCVSLTSVALPDGLTSIEDHAFIECVSLTGITVPASVTFIGNQAFAYCDGLTGITVDGENADYCDADGVLFTKDMKTLLAYPAAKTDASYVIPDSVTFVGTSAFAGCTSLQSVTVPASVMSMGSFAFSGCDNLTITGYTGSAAETYANENGIPFVSIGNAAEVESASGTCGADGDNLTWVLTSDGTLTISGTGAMADWGVSLDGGVIVQNYAPWGTYMEIIKKVVIEPGVTSVGNSAFQNCTKLTGITIPEGVTSIGSSAFVSCWNLTDVTIPASVTLLPTGAFSDCTNLQNITVDSSSANYCDVDGVLFTKDKTTLVAYPTAKAAAGYVIPDGVIFVGNSAFAGCSALTSVTVPASVTSIGFSAFFSCSNLSGITVDLGNTAYCDVDGVLFSKDKTRLITYPAGKSDAAYVIPAGVTDIDASAFQNCKNLQTVTIPNGVSYLGNLLFVNCSNLTDVTVPASVTVIELAAFFGCDVTIHGYAGSYAEVFAAENGIPFVSLGEAPIAVKGDVNGDGVFDYYDVSKLYAFFRGKSTLDSAVDTDINGDGAFDYYDVSKLYAIFRGRASFN